MSASPPSRTKDAAEAWNDVLSRAFQVFSGYHWHILERQTPELMKDVRSITVRNAALESSLMSIRDLDDFLGSGNSKGDDIRATHFGFTAGKRILTADEREAINKKLGHLTYRSLEERRQRGPNSNPRTWNLAEFIQRAMTQFLEFLAYLRDKFFEKDKPQQAIVDSAMGVILQTTTNITAIAEMELEFTA